MIVKHPFTRGNAISFSVLSQSNRCSFLRGLITVVFLCKLWMTWNPIIVLYLLQVLYSFYWAKGNKEYISLQALSFFCAFCQESDSMFAMCCNCFLSFRGSVWNILGYTVYGTTKTNETDSYLSSLVSKAKPHTTHLLIYQDVHSFVVFSFILSPTPVGIDWLC